MVGETRICWKRSILHLERSAQMRSLFLIKKAQKGTDTAFNLPQKEKWKFRLPGQLIKIFEMSRPQSFSSSNIKC